MATEYFSMLTSQYAVFCQPVRLQLVFFHCFLLVIPHMHFCSFQSILNVEWTKRNCFEPNYSHIAAVMAINRCLPFTDLKKTKMVPLPYL
jgi:hypothetical protein